LEKKSELSNTVSKLSTTENELEEIRSSVVFSQVNKFVRWLDRNFPQGTRRGEFLKLCSMSSNVVKNEGLKGLYRNAQIYLHLYGTRQTLTLAPTDKYDNKKTVSKDVITNNYFTKILDKKPESDKVKKRKKVDIIIPVYNSYNFVKKCIESVLKYSENSRIIIIDDASTDKNIEIFLNQLSKSSYDDKELIILRNKTNLGFVKTVNIGYKNIKNHFVILNSDTEVSEGWLDRLFAPIIENENLVASVTPFSNSATICSFPNFIKDNHLFKGLDPKTIDNFFRQYGLPLQIEIPTGVGFCLAFNRAITKKIGFFDEIFEKGFGEENDWCMRALKSGYKNVIATNLFVYHNHGTSFQSEEKKILMKQNLEKLLTKHPDYQKKVDTFILEDELQPLREIYSILLDNSTRGKKKLVLLIDHNLGGGAIQFSDKIYEELGNDANILQIKYDYHKKTILLNYHGYVNKKLRLRNANPEILLSKIISFFKVDHILVNQVITWKALELLSIIRQSNVSYSVYMHDYFPICPSWNLLNYEGNFCGIPEISKCQECLDKNTSEYADYKYFYPNEKFNMFTWRKEFFEFLSNADDIICFSESSKKLLLKAYDKLTNVKVSEHFVTINNKDNISKKILHNKKILTVAIPGAISYLKGEKIIQNLVKHPKFNDLPVKIVILGYTREKLSDKKNKLIVHGKYETNELPSLLNKYDVDLIFIPSVCPETFSFTTSEALLLGYPVLCFDLGAPAERVKKFKAGIVIDKIDVDSIIKVFNEIIKNPSMLDEFSKNALNYNPPSFSKHLKSITEKFQK